MSRFGYGAMRWNLNRMNNFSKSKNTIYLDDRNIRNRVVRCYLSDGDIFVIQDGCEI